ncbi:MAG: hypothetical protein HY804_10620 [Nitrospinae bacterium]|nr:hypothetical protein [Nitrospinota bacterium]
MITASREKGMIKEVIVDPSKVFYEPKTTDHHHYFNVDTGELIDFEAELPALREMASVPEGMELVGVDVTVRVRSSAMAAASAGAA